jgi:hypothetical protein
MKEKVKVKNLLNEKWVGIEGFLGSYMISNKGRVKSLDRIVKTSNNRNFRVNGSLKSLCTDKGGYKKVGLRHKDSYVSYHLVHRLVAQAFIINKENKPQVNHKDGVKSNNCVENLEWCTPSENIIHAFRNGLVVLPSGENHYMRKLKGKKSHSTKEVICTKTGKRWVSVKEVSNELSIPYSTLAGMLNGSKVNTTTLKYYTSKKIKTNE